MGKKLLYLILLVVSTILISSCGVRFPKDEPIGVWTSEDSQFTFDFKECLAIGDIVCTIKLNGDDYTFKDVVVPWGENKLELGAYGEIIEGTNGRMFDPELCLNYSIEDNKLLMSVYYSIYEEYPVGTVLEFEYQGEGDGVIKWP